MKRYLVITDLDYLESRDTVVKNDLVLCLNGRYKWLIDLEEGKAFAPEKNEWLPFKDFPVF